MPFDFSHFSLSRLNARYLEASRQIPLGSKTRNQLSGLWTRQAVGRLIAQVSGVVMPIRTVGEYLKRWGMTPLSSAQAGV